MEINPGVVALQSLHMHAAAAAAVAQRARQEAARIRQENETAARRSHQVFAERTRHMLTGRLAPRPASLGPGVCRDCADGSRPWHEHRSMRAGEVAW